MTNELERTETMTVKGQIVHYHPMSDDEVNGFLGRCTPKQRLVLHHTARGLELQESAAEAGVSRETVVMWRKRVPGYHSAYYTLLSGSRSIGLEAIRSMAQADALEHYNTVLSLSKGEAESAAERSVKLNAAKEGLTLAGAYKGMETPTVSIQHLLVQIMQQCLADAPGGIEPPSPLRSNQSEGIDG